ncbi:MAG: caspase family protein, partial [Planctomycetota bacterium]
WDLEPMQPKLLSRRTVAKPALDVEIINDMQLDSMQELIAAQSRELVVFSIDDNGAFADDPTQRLGIAEGGIEEVAFLTDTKGYQVAIKRQQPAASPKVSDEENTTDIFDLSRVRLLNPPNPDDASLVPSRRLPSRWSVQPTATQSGLRYQFFQDQQAGGVLPLVPELHGGVTSLATMPQRLNNPPAIDQRDVDRQPETEPAPGLLIVGTGGRHGIYCFGADQSDTPRLLRQFRGHAGDVVSLGTSTDGRYLVSASSDSTIKVWNLDGIFTASTSVNRWGVDFQLISGASGPRLVAATVRADGPLHFRGVRGGDELISIRWADTSGKAYSVSAPNRIKTLLDQLPFDTLVVFNFTRLGRPQPGFQSFAAWRPLSTLLLDRDREWANWTPAGVFNASINGHRRFGWQINRGTSMLPDYYRAEQFRQTLERPDVMRRLMATGSLDAAMQTSLGAIIKPPGTEAIANQIQTQPRIKILSPRSGSTVGQSSINVVAEVSVPMGGELVPPKAFINGVPGRNRQRFVSVADQSDGNIAPQSIKQRFQWTFDLPRQTNLQLEVFASTQARSVGRATCQFRRTLDAKTRVSRRLHLLAIGVSEYRDRQIQSLDFASRATGVISDVFRTHAQPRYRVSTDILTDGDATGGMWRVFAESTVDRLMNAVSPDDLVVMYLCGHGMRDRRTNQWYFVTADARYRDLMNNQFSDCLALNDLSLFSKLPCRKLAILDSCHSGAVQDFMRPDDLKSALRYLQEDVVLTWTASEGDQEAAEKREDRLGRFTTHLVDALSGMADANDHGGNEDQVVTLKEAIAYVSRKVRDESFSEGIPQSPTAGPSDLIDAVELPLATRSN